MNRKELVRKVSEMTEEPMTKIDPIVDATFYSIADALSHGEEVRIPNFGRFIVSEVPEKTGRNPKTGESLIVPKHNKLTFKQSKVLKDIVK